MSLAIIQNCSYHVEQHTPIKTPIGSEYLMAFVVYAMPVVAVFGVLGNITAFIILKTSALRITSHFYLACLTVADILSLISMFPTYWAVVLLQAYYEVRDRTHVTWVENYLVIYGVCQARMFTTFLFRTLSVWLIVLFTAERVLTVVWPLKAVHWCTVRNGIISVLVLVIVAAAINLPWMFSFERLVKPCTKRVACVPNKVLIVNRFIEFIILTLIPAVLICAGNAVIAVTLKRQTRGMFLADSRGLSRLQRVITRRLLAVSCSFVLLTFPSLVTVSVLTVHDLQPNAAVVRGHWANLYHISMLLFSVNLAINFILYLLTGKNFRMAAWYLVSCQCERMERYRSALGKASAAAGGGGDSCTGEGKAGTVSTGKTMVSNSSFGYQPPRPDETKKVFLSSPYNSGGINEDHESPMMIPLTYLGPELHHSDRKYNYNDDVIGVDLSNEEAAVNGEVSVSLLPSHGQTTNMSSMPQNVVLLPAVKPRLQRKPEPEIIYDVPPRIDTSLH